MKNKEKNRGEEDEKIREREKRGVAVWREFHFLQDRVDVFNV